MYSSSLRFNETLGRCLSKLGFERSECEDNIWIRDAGDRYEYITTYVDDLCIVCKDPQKLLSQLQGQPFNFKLKGSQPIAGAVHLGCAFSRDSEGVLNMEPNQYIKRMEDTFDQHFPDERLSTRV